MRAAASLWERERGVRIEWEARSLTAFGEEPLEAVADRFDLLVIDHPFVGTAHKSACLAPLDELLDTRTLRALAQDAIGPSHLSYAYGDHQYGLATDAACQVAVVRDDLLVTLPESFDDVLELARELPQRVAIPLAPADAICNFLTLRASGLSGHAALTWLGKLAALAHPESLWFTPPLALDRMSSTDEIAYVPLAFGYSNYSRDGRKRRLRFLDIPGTSGSVLGGAGLAVSTASAHAEDAAAFAAWASGAEAQRTVLFPAGGQPGSRRIWLDPQLDERVGGFFSGTLATIESAWVRPREPWWPAFQLAAGRAIHRFLADDGDYDKTLAAIAPLDHLSAWTRRVPLSSGRNRHAS
jgi:multiple sugar transport system substrate-binding protein